MKALDMRRNLRNSLRVCREHLAEMQIYKLTMKEEC